MVKIRVAVGISGGVDSALAAALLKEQGHEVSGVFLECWNEPGCRTDQDRQDALGVALKLKIPFKVLDFKKEYKQKVLDIFYREYKAGRTPNPDILCNQEIKFGMFLEWAMKNHFDLVATGHYARIFRKTRKGSEDSENSDKSEIQRIRKSENLIIRKSDNQSYSEFSEIKLLQSRDKFKDQTYFLAMLKQEQLKQVLFPIGNLTKKQVRLEAKKRGLKVWDKKDSSGICFINEELNFRQFLQREIKEHEGEVVIKITNDQLPITNKKKLDCYKVIGRHKGVEFYTIGQRHNLEITEKSIKRPRYFVIQKDIQQNRLIVGKKPDLARKEFEVERWSTIIPNIQFPISNLTCRIRHQGRLMPCKIEGKRVRLGSKEFGIAPGQVAVIYRGVECLGGGVIKI